MPHGRWPRWRASAMHWCCGVVSRIATKAVPSAWSSAIWPLPICSWDSICPLLVCKTIDSVRITMPYRLRGLVRGAALALAYWPWYRRKYRCSYWHSFRWNGICWLPIHSVAIVVWPCTMFCCFCSRFGWRALRLPFGPVSHGRCQRMIKLLILSLGHCESIRRKQNYFLFIRLSLVFDSVIYWRDSTHYYATYSGTCFPLHLRHRFPLGWEYSAVVFMGINMFLLLLIAVLYTMLLISIWRTRRATPLAVFDCEFAIR